jgi:hypothetical protein
MTRHARIEIVPPRAQCDPHPDWERCPTTDATDEQCLRYLGLSGLPHHLRLVATNGRTLATSEKYANLTNARRALDAWVAAWGDMTGWSAVINPEHIVELDIDGNVRP